MSKNVVLHPVPLPCSDEFRDVHKVDGQPSQTEFWYFKKEYTGALTLAAVLAPDIPVRRADKIWWRAAIAVRPPPKSTTLEARAASARVSVITIPYAPNIPSAPYKSAPAPPAESMFMSTSIARTTWVPSACSADANRLCLAFYARAMALLHLQGWTLGAVEARMLITKEDKATPLFLELSPAFFFPPAQLLPAAMQSDIQKLLALIETVLGVGEVKKMRSNVEDIRARFVYAFLGGVERPVLGGLGADAHSPRRRWCAWYYTQGDETTLQANIDTCERVLVASGDTTPTLRHCETLACAIHLCAHSAQLAPTAAVALARVALEHQYRDVGGPAGGLIPTHDLGRLFVKALQGRLFYLTSASLIELAYDAVHGESIAAVRRAVYSAALLRRIYSSPCFENIEHAEHTMLHDDGPVYETVRALTSPPAAVVRHDADTQTEGSLRDFVEPIIAELQVQRTSASATDAAKLIVWASADNPFFL